MMRSIGIFLALLFLATGAWAENGLQRFERELKPQLGLEKLSYGAAEALGDQGFVLKEVVAVAPPTPQTDDKRTTIKIDKVTVESVDFERFKASNKEDLPRFLKMKFEGVTGDEATANALAAYGLPKVPADLTLDYKLDTAAKRLTVEKLELSLRGLGRIEFSLVIDGVSDKADEVEDAKESGRLQSASITIDDKGLLSRLIVAVATSQGNKPEDLVALGLLTLSSFTGQQDAESMKAFDAVASFVGDWRAPKGPITITARPAKGASFADAGRLMMPNALREVLGLTVIYAGTRAGAAAPK
jgi:hypothetical protein